MSLSPPSTEPAGTSRAPVTLTTKASPGFTSAGSTPASKAWAARGMAAEPKKARTKKAAAKALKPVTRDMT
ncbi:MAG: hypothetical protein Kow0025_10540 [Thermodesulfovibrionales bacterium]